VGRPYATPPARRSTDHGLAAAVRSVIRWGSQWDPGDAGQAMLLVAGLITALSYPALTHRTSDWIAFTGVSLGMLAVLGLCRTVRWSHLPPRALLVFPVLVWAAVAALGLTAHGVGANYLGLFVLSFAYIGLMQKAGTGTVLAPGAAVCYVAAYGTWSRLLVPRLVIALVVWVLVAEILAALQTRQRELAAALHRAAHTDPLTALANRRDFDLRLATAAPGDLLVVSDIDHFKRVNDTHGHAAGDAVLADFGLLLSQSLRAVDYAARLGGEEFALLLSATDPALAPVILSRLRHRWSVLHPDVTFSCGVASVLPGRPPREILATADAALYAAKDAGRNRDFADSGPIGPPPREQPVPH
jgi:diguanylate cyclase